MLDPDITVRLPQKPVVSTLGAEPTEEEVAKVMKAMPKPKAVGPGGLLAELLNARLQ